ncbi:MAG: SoxR reducing system RseC family protein [Clostridia bacterium]|nr:SoxR reducing system RseC family protein [Clostridia bacterium]
MERTGEVKAVDGQWLEIEFCRPSDCEKCNACHGGSKVMNLRIRGEAKVGDKAVVYLPPSAVTQASFIAYAIPAAGLLLGILLGEKLFPTANSIGGAIGGVIGVAIPALGIYIAERRRKADPRWTPQLLRVIPRAEINE